MVSFTATIKQFPQRGEKTGWYYLDIPADLAELIKPGNRRAFRVKGKLDKHQIKQVSLLPMGQGNFILPVNATMRKAIRKNKGAMLNVQLAEDKKELAICQELLDCLADEPIALKNFEKLVPSHKRYFSNWVTSAKTDSTKAKRIAKSVNALARGLNYGEMIREE